MPKREWTELDEQMAREGDATKRGMRSVGHRPGSRNDKTTEHGQKLDLTRLIPVR